MSHSTSVTVHVAQPAKVVWAHLTRGPLISRWFADSGDLAEGGDFRFDFGDGDYFTGRVVGWEEARRLELRWRFMGVGTEFHIRFTLDESDGATEVEVHDEGSRPVEDVRSLQEGWTDFLERLERCVRTGERTRYEWSQTIGAGAFAASDRKTLRESLRDSGWWRAHFPGSEPALVAAGDHQITVDFRSQEWGSARTRAVLTLEDDPAGTYLAVSQAGFTELPEPVRLAERRRMAGLWSAALQGLEAASASAP